MSSIEWTDETWNPVTGCDRVSPGCAHCYALTFAARLKAMGNPKYQRDGDPETSGPGFGVTLHPDALEQPSRWRKPRMVFVNSMSDLFHEQVPFEFIDRVFEAMASAPQHTFQVLTKRPERMREYMSIAHPQSEPLPHVWLGTSIENRRFVYRADVLRDTPAAARFISAEPLLGPLVHDCATAGAAPVSCWEDGFDGAQLDLTGIDWLIVGGESGNHRRPARLDWVRDLRDAVLRDHDDVVGLDRPHDRFPRWALCGTAFFFKQWGGFRPKDGGRELDGRTWDELPAGATLGVPVGQTVMRSP